MLESREVPAVFNWIGTNGGGFANPANWYGGGSVAPTNGDDLYFGTVPQGKTISCDVPLTSLVGVHLVNGYTGTVSLHHNTTVGNLEVGSGSIAQIASSTGNDLVVTERLAFTGGTLNNTVNSGVVHLTGTATQGSSSYVSSSTVSSTNLGSTLSVEGSGNNIAKLYFNGGVLNCVNGANVYIGEKGFGQSGPQDGLVGPIFVPVELRSIWNIAGAVEVKGEWNVAKRSPLKAISFQVTNANAKVTIHDNVTLSIKDVIAFTLSDGQVTVDAGVTLKVDPTAAVDVSGGTFTTVSGTVTIDGMFQQQGGKLQLGGSGTFILTPVFGELLVKGNAFLLAGGIDGADVDDTGSNCDRITCSAKIKFGVAYTYTVLTLGVAQNKVYNPFSAKDGFEFVDATKLPITAGYTSSLNTVPNQPAVIQIKKN